MNRQARRAVYGDLDQPNEWVSFGNVPLLEAARLMAVAAAKEANYPCFKWQIEVRCKDSPEIPVETFTVRTFICAEVLDPRKGAE